MKLSEWLLSLMSDCFFFFFFLPQTILDCLSSTLENTIITLFVMKPGGVFVLRSQLSCLIALKFSVFPPPSVLKIYIVFFSHCPVQSVSVLQGPFVSAFVLQCRVCFFSRRCDGSAALGWGLVFDNSPWTELKWNSPNGFFKVSSPKTTADNVQGHILD